MKQASQVRVLIVEERGNSLVSSAFDQMSVAITLAQQEADFVTLVRGEEFALLVIDAGVPRQVALKIVSTIRGVKGHEHTPVIVLVDQEDEAQEFEVLAVDVLTPRRREALRMRAGVFVDLARKRQEVLAQAEVLRRRARQLQGLASASVAIHAPGLALQHRLSSLVETARDILEAHQAVIAVSFRLPQRRRQQESVAWSLSEKYRGHRVQSKEEAWRSRALLSNETSVVRLSRAELARITSTLGDDGALPWHGVVVAPLLDAEGVRLGLLEVSDKHDGDFNDDDEAILIQLAQLGAVALQNCINEGVREANRIKDEFLGVLSHELRIPLHAILGWTQHLKGLVEPCGPVAHGLEVIGRNVRAQSDLVEDLLDVSRITSGKLQLQRRRVALRGLVREVVESCEPLAESKGVKLSVHTAESIKTIVGDRGRLRQVLNNLVSNAIKFTPRGKGVEVRVDEDERDVIIRVTDKGQGITPEFLPFVFERFRQDLSARRGQRGLGLGLAIVRHIVELHGGQVDAFSKGSGQGATFTVRLPRRGFEPILTRDEIPTPAPSSPSAF